MEICSKNIVNLDFMNVIKQILYVIGQQNKTVIKWNRLLQRDETLTHQCCSSDLRLLLANQRIRSLWTRNWSTPGIGISWCFRLFWNKRKYLACLVHVCKIQGILRVETIKETRYKYHEPSYCVIHTGPWYLRLILMAWHTLGKFTYSS